MGKDRKPTPAPENENNKEDDPSPSEDDHQTTEPENQTTADITETDSNPTTTKSSPSSTMRSSTSSTSSGSGGYIIETANYIEENSSAVDTAAVSQYLATITGSSVPATTGAITSATTKNVTVTPESNKPTSTGSDVPPSTDGDISSSTGGDVLLPTETQAPSSTKAPDPTTKEEPPPPPTVAPVNPPSQPSCYPSPSGHYQDSHESNMKALTGWFCDTWAKDVNHGPTVNVNQTTWSDAYGQYWHGNDYDDDVYEFSVKNIDGCMPGDAGFDLAEPVAGQKCYDILVWNWKGCTGNKGRGGVTQAGCLSYSLRTVY